MEKDGENKKLAVRVILEKDYKYLLVQQKAGEALGLWNLPGGKAEPGEDIMDAAKREVLEETGYEIGSLEKVFEIEAHEYINYVFFGIIIDGDLRIKEDEIADADWFSYEQIEAMPEKMRNAWTIEAIKSYEEQNKNFIL
jgi:8-oxo-dGTP pyrophosphatase MutT (NUDIX family)